LCDFDKVIIVFDKMLHFVGSFSPGNAAANTGRNGKLNSHLMAGCVRNIIRTKNYQ